MKLKQLKTVLIVQSLLLLTADLASAMDEIDMEGDQTMRTETARDGGPGNGPRPGWGAQPAPAPQPGYGAQPAPAPQPGWGPRPAPAPQPGWGSNPSIGPSHGYGPRPGWGPNPGYGPHPGWGPNPGWGPGHNHGPRPGWLPQPYPIWGNNSPWRRWEHPFFMRPIYYFNWYQVKAITCSAQDSLGRFYPVMIRDWPNWAWADNIHQIEDLALDRCFHETGGDPSCFLQGCWADY